MVLLLLPVVGLSQNKKTAKYIQSAQNQFVNGYLKEGLKNLDLAVANEPDLASTYHLRASFKLELLDLLGALEDYSKAIKLDPNFHDAYKSRGILRTQNGSYKGALADFNKAIELEPKRSDNRNNRGFLYIQMKEFDLAIPDLEKAVELNIHNIKAYENLVQAYEEAGRIINAWEAANSFVMTNPNEVSAYLERGRMTFMLGSCFSAIQDYDKAIAIAPEDYRAYVERGRLRDDCVEDERGAVLDFDKAIALNPGFLYAYYSRTSPNFDLGNYDAIIKDCDFYIARDTTYAPIYAQRGVVKSILKDFQEAMKDLKKAIALEPADSYAYIQLSISLIMQEKHKEAGAVLELYLDQFPEDQEALFQRATALNYSGEFEKAILELDQLVQLDSTNFLFYYLRGKAKEGAGDLEGACEDMLYPAQAQVEDSKDFVLTKCGEYMNTNEVLSGEHFYNASGFIMMGNYNAALIELEKAILLDTTNKFLFYERGNAKQKLSKPDEAIVDFNKAIALDSNFARPYGSIGYIESSRANYEKAKKYLLLAIESDSRDPSYYNNIGVLELEAKNFELAIPYFEKAIELDSNKLNSYLSLSECYASLGQMDKTCEVLEQAVQSGHEYAARLQAENCQ